MGVPKFFRWLSERYPCLSERVRENQIPEFDNLYLDMNGIIHACSHPNDEDPHFRISEQQIFQDIFRYIEVLFRIIRPQKVFFMAVDGVAPRAKMNQQRARRFMSAQTALDLIQKAKRRGEELPKEDRFDSNCITPGTVFMAKLHEQLKYFVNMKITTDETWQGIHIYLSGHDVPGEGEHKIMDFIRYQRSQPNYNPNTRHCLYGLDADLIMLGMCSHEPYFCLLREEVKFFRPTKKDSLRTANAEKTTFYLLHLPLLRDYIELEFDCVKKSLPFGFNLENIIDDWVLMGFLIGNDFIPHLPDLHIHASALPTLYAAYRKVLPELGGYMNEGGYLNLPRFEKYLKTLTYFDRDNFQDTCADLAWLESRSAGDKRFPSRDIRKNVPRYVYGPNSLVPYVDSEPEPADESPDVDNGTVCKSELDHVAKDEVDEDISNMSEELQDLIRRSNANLKLNDESSGSGTEGSGEKNEPVSLVEYGLTTDNDDDSSDSWSPALEVQFSMFKSDYYKNKMSYTNVTAGVLHDQAVQYVRAIQWNLHYYYNGICSWSWYYPHHYAPYLSDVKGFSNMTIEFELGEPFLPFQQLLAVLPSGSKNLLPIAYQALMTDSQSPVIDFYPCRFDTDLNGKKNDWEAVILIPFIKEDRLLDAMHPLDSRLTDEEKARNRHGRHLKYVTALHDKGFYQSSLAGVFPDLRHNKAKCKPLDKNHFRLSPSQIRKGLLTQIQLDKFLFGFSTLKHLPFTSEFQHLGVLVFQQNSRNESMQITLTDQTRCHEPLHRLATRLLGTEVRINWPHMRIGRVCAVAAEGEQIFLEGNNVKRAVQTPKDYQMEMEIAENIREMYSTRKAVNIGPVNVLVYVYPLLGTRCTNNRMGNNAPQKKWGRYPVPYALQTVVEAPLQSEIGRPQTEPARSTIPRKQHAQQPTPEMGRVTILRKQQTVSVETKKHESNAPVWPKSPAFPPSGPRAVPPSGKSIMNEIFPPRPVTAQSASGTSSKGMVIVNSNIKKEPQQLEEKSRQLRSILKIGPKEPVSKRLERQGTVPPGSGSHEQHHQQRRTDVQQKQKAVHKPIKEAPQQGSPRVPYTARQPKPPPFLPDFTPSSPVAPAPPQQPQPQQQQPPPMPQQQQPPPMPQQPMYPPSSYLTWSQGTLPPPVLQQVFLPPFCPSWAPVSVPSWQMQQSMNSQQPQVYQQLSQQQLQPQSYRQPQTYQQSQQRPQVQSYQQSQEQPNTEQSQLQFCQQPQSATAHRLIPAVLHNGQYPTQVRYDPYE